MTHSAVHDAVTPADQHGWESPPIGTIAPTFAPYICVGSGKLVQKALEGINAAHGIDPGPERRFTALNIVWIVFVSLFFLLAAAALLLPAPEA